VACRRKIRIAKTTKRRHALALADADPYRIGDRSSSSRDDRFQFSLDATSLVMAK
jgi:hypothetical protein